MTVPPSLRRAGRILGWSLLGLVLVLFFALAGGMVFLRTQPGERWIADRCQLQGLSGDPALTGLDRGYGCFRSEKCGH